MIDSDPYPDPTKPHAPDTLLIPTLSIKLEAFDRHHQPLKSISTPARSWLLNFYHIIKMLLPQEENVSTFLKDYSGTEAQFRAFSSSHPWDAVSGMTQIGVGDSSTSFNPAHYKLQGSNSYWADISGAVDVPDENLRFFAEIDCIAALTVKEVGIRFPKVQDVYGTSHVIMVERTVLDSDNFLEVPAGGKVKATYQLNYP